MTPSERLREALGFLYSVAGRDGVDEATLGNARTLVSIVLNHLEQDEVKAPPEEIASAVHRLQLSIWDACSQHPSEKRDPALQALLRDSEVVFAAALKSQAVETEDPCPLCDGKGRIPNVLVTREDRQPDSDDSWNAYTAANYRATYGKDPPRHLYNPGTPVGGPEALAALRRLVWMLPLVERAAVLCPPTEANPLEPPRMRLEAVPDLVEVLPPDGTRDAVVTSARELLGQVRIPLGYRVVMVATDESGAFVGVHSNVDPGDTHAILVCALRGEDRQDYPP